MKNRPLVHPYIPNSVEDVRESMLFESFRRYFALVNSFTARLTEGFVTSKYSATSTQRTYPCF